MADAMTGKELREYVESGGRVFLAPSYGGYYWTVEWTDKEGILKLAAEMEKVQQWMLDREREDVKEYTLAVERVGDDGDLCINVVFE